MVSIVYIGVRDDVVVALSIDILLVVVIVIIIDIVVNVAIRGSVCLYYLNIQKLPLNKK